MITYSVYRVVHLLGIFLLLVILGGLSYGATRADAGGAVSRRTGMILHGLALFIVLLGGFGLLARLGIVHGMNWPGWVWAKVFIWALLGAAVVVPRRKPEWAGALLLLLPVLGGVAAWLAIFKPF
jgi:hypothetical protein